MNAKQGTWIYSGQKGDMARLAFWADWSREWFGVGREQAGAEAHRPVRSLQQ